MSRNLNIKYLIALVQAQPIIWNKTLGEYKDSTLTKNAWIDICREIDNEFDFKSEKEKKLIRKDIMKKWWNIRDGFVRSCKKRKKSLAGFCSTKKYVYHDQLQFLTQMTQSVHDYENSIQTVKSLSVFRKPVSKNLENDPLQRKILDILEESENRHLSFFKGIIPSLNTLNDEEVIEFQAGVLQLISKIKRQKRLNPSFTHATYITHPELIYPLQSVGSCNVDMPADTSFHQRVPYSPLSRNTQYTSNSSQFSTELLAKRNLNTVSPALSISSNTSTDSADYKYN